MKRLSLIIVFSAVFLSFLSCKQGEPGDGSPSDLVVPALQKKVYVESSKDLEGKINKFTSGLIVNLYDSKHFADNERILSVSYTAEAGDIVGFYFGGSFMGAGPKVTMEWASDDSIDRPVVGRRESPGQFGITCIPGEYKGKFTVVTSRYTYDFTKSITLKSGNISFVDLDFSAPDKQPTRKVGILGDSISTFDGALCNSNYHPFYPSRDPNVGKDAAKAVDTKEKTYWWRLIYDYMEHGELDANSSWSGTCVIHEVKSGRKNNESIGAGFVDRAYDFVDPDIVVIHGGTNDTRQPSPLGTYDYDYPIEQLNDASFRSAYIKIIKMLQARYEGVQIIIIIGDCITASFESSIIEIANHFGIPYVDFVGVAVEKCSGSHPTAPAFDMMAKTIHDKMADYLP